MRLAIPSISIKDWVSVNPPMSSTTYKAIWTVWMWIITMCVTFTGMLIILIVAAGLNNDFETPRILTDIYDSWLLALSAFSGITTAEFYGKRKTHIPEKVISESPEDTSVLTDDNEWADGRKVIL